MTKNKMLLYLGDAVVSGYSGIEAYHRNLIASIETGFDIVVSRNPDKETQFPKNTNIIIRNRFIKKIIGVLKNFIPFEFFFPGYSLIITDSYTPVSISRKTKIYTIVHDLMSITERKNYPFFARIYSFFSTRTYKRADNIITVSNATKNEIIRLLRIQYDKITVIPNVTAFAAERGHTEDYFMYMGEMRMNKNLKNVILGFIEYKKKSGVHTKLVLCGRKNFEYAELSAIVGQNGFSDEILFTGYISVSEKFERFSKTKGLILLSNNEGFGIPVIEALTNNIPVLVSDIPVLREVTAGAGIYVNQNDIHSIAGGFASLSDFKVNKDFIAICDELRQRYSINAFKLQIRQMLSFLEEK